jgi:anti-sigma B factor antagonist
MHDVERKAQPVHPSHKEKAQPQVGGVEIGIVSLHGRITVNNANEMRRTLADGLRSQPPQLIVDVSDVPYMDTSGLATLIESLRIANQQGTRLLLRGIQSQPCYLLKVSELDRVLELEEVPNA